METAFYVLASFIAGLLVGGVVMISCWKDEMKAGVSTIGGRAYRCTPIDR